MTLGKLTDKLTEALDDAADAIDALHLGVPARVPMGGEDRHLVWRKQGGDWMLLVEMADGSEHRIDTVSRANRIMVAAVLPLLHEALLEAHASTTKDVEDAIAAVLAFTAGLRSPQAKEDDK
jgi:hypothetical protein